MKVVRKTTKDLLEDRLEAMKAEGHEGSEIYMALQEKISKMDKSVLK